MCRQSVDRNVCIDGELCVLVWNLCQMICDPAGIPHKFDVMKLLAPCELQLKAATDCGFQNTLGQYFLPDMKSRLPYFYKACQNTIHGLITAIVRDLSGRRALVCSTPFDPVFMKFGLRSSLKTSLELWCRSLTLRHFLRSGRAVDVHRQYMTALQWYQREWGSGGDDVPVVSNVIDMWLSYPHWDVAAELSHVVRVFLVTVASPSYSVDFVDPVSTALTHDAKMSAIHLVRSWFSGLEQSRRGKVTTELAVSCDAAKLLHLRLHDEHHCQPWAMLLRGNREFIQSSFLSTPSASYENEPAVGDYDADWMRRLDELGPEGGNSPPSRRTRAKKSKPVTKDDVVIPK